MDLAKERPSHGTCSDGKTGRCSGNFSTVPDVAGNTSGLLEGPVAI